MLLGAVDRKFKFSLNWENTSKNILNLITARFCLWILNSKYQIINKVECPFLELELAEKSAKFNLGNLVGSQMLSRGTYRKMYIYILRPECTNSGYQVAVAAQSFTVEPNIFGSSVWYVLRVTFLASRILRCLIDFWKISAPLS